MSRGLCGVGPIGLDCLSSKRKEKNGPGGARKGLEVRLHHDPLIQVCATALGETRLIGSMQIDALTLGVLLRVMRARPATGQCPGSVSTWNKPRRRGLRHHATLLQASVNFPSRAPPRSMQFHTSRRKRRSCEKQLTVWQRRAGEYTAILSYTQSHPSCVPAKLSAACVLALREGITVAGLTAG